MTIEETDVVDIVSFDRISGDVNLTISDHLDWDDEETHLLMLQEKINMYLHFIESGALVDAYPEAHDKGVSINVVGKHQLSRTAAAFLK